MESPEEKSVRGRELSVEKEDLPLTINYKEKRYVLVLTGNDKLLLHKALD